MRLTAQKQDQLHRNVDRNENVGLYLSTTRTRMRGTVQVYAVKNFLVQVNYLCIGFNNIMRVTEFLFIVAMNKNDTFRCVLVLIIHKFFCTFISIHSHVLISYHILA